MQRSKVPHMTCILNCSAVEVVAWEGVLLLVSCGTKSGMESEGLWLGLLVEAGGKKKGRLNYRANRRDRRSEKIGRKWESETGISYHSSLPIPCMSCSLVTRSAVRGRRAWRL